LTVTECLRLARYRQERLSFIDKASVIHLPEAAFEVLTKTGLTDYAGEIVANLSHGMKRALELATVLAMDPTVLILDEPTAGLTKEDRQIIGNILSDLQKRHGIAILLIEHDFDFVKQVCSRLVVLHRGKLVVDGTAAEVAASAIVQDIYSGQAQ
jgi:branched-chain amino acid transport system permease protein